MSNKFKINSVFVFLAAVLFNIFFMVSKHDAALSTVNAFADDPYDAIGSFGVQAAMFLGVLSLIRVFRGAPSEEQKIFAVRTQMAAILAAAVTLAGDLVAMTRFPSLWVGTSAGYRLASLVSGMVFIVIVAGWLVLRSTKAMTVPTIPNLWRRAVIISLIAVAIAGFYPINWRQETLGELFTVVVGVLLLFAPMWALGTAFHPYDPETRRDAMAVSTGSRRHKYYWGWVVLLGIAMGTFLVVRTEAGGSQPPVPVVLFVVSVYISLETTGLLIGYGFLRKTLGLFRRVS